MGKSPGTVDVKFEFVVHPMVLVLSDCLGIQFFSERGQFGEHLIIDSLPPTL